MQTKILPNKHALGHEAASRGAQIIRDALAAKGRANIIVATGASQFETLAQLVLESDLRWDLVTAFHLDEYVGLPLTHPASFRQYLWTRFVSKLPLPLEAFHYINAEVDPQAECARLSSIIQRHPIDLAFVGIGENGHLAFNDPPADFQTTEPYLVVNLDADCRKQQMGEGWFDTIDSVPKQAISMSCRQIMKSKAIIASVPDERKAKAVKLTLEGPVTAAAPASILQQHEATWVYLDPQSAMLLKK